MNAYHPIPGSSRRHTDLELDSSPRDLFPRDACVTCDSSTPVCNCAANEQCILAGRTCQQCPTIQCIPNPSSGSGGGINPGVIAGPVVAVLLILSVVALWWLRRKRKRALSRLEELAQRARKAEAAGFHLSQPGSPAPGSLRSADSRGSLPAPPHSALRHSQQRSPLPSVPVAAEYYDENGTTALRTYKGNGNGGVMDPFSDGQSFSTAGSEAQSDHIIPIQYIPPSKSDENVMEVSGSTSAQGQGQGYGHGHIQSEAARKLDEARKNLFRPGQVPMRPARSPDLDLRLNVPRSGPPSRASDNRSRISSSNQIRDSYLSGISGAPSYISGVSSDLHYDTPKIITSKQIQIGRLQQAEVVQLGRQGQNLSQHQHQPAQGDYISTGSRLSPVDAFLEQYQSSPSPNPFDARARSPASLSTFSSQQQGSGGPRSAHAQSFQSDMSGSGSGSGGGTSYRTLTPTSRRFGEEGENEEGLQTELEDPPSSAGSTDLRFSMGSLAYRDSMSSMGTGRYLAQPDPNLATNNGGGGSGGGGMGSAPRIGNGQIFGPPPSSSSTELQGQGQGARESMTSYKSEAYSVLGSFPMITPGAAMGVPSPSALAGNGLPHSSSVSTLEHASMPMGKPRPVTATSMADSFLGTFPFVPPNREDMAALPSRASMASEGLGGFDFELPIPDEPVPQIPTQHSRR